MTDFERALQSQGWHQAGDGTWSCGFHEADGRPCRPMIMLENTSAWDEIRKLYEAGTRDAMRPTPIADGLPEPGVAVMALVRTTNNSGSSWRRWLRGIYAAERTLEALTEDCDIDYDADEGVAYCNPGWYESNEFEDVHWRIHDDVLAWMPLPPTNFGEGEQ